jgi:hypothetical protein
MIATRMLQDSALEYLQGRKTRDKHGFPAKSLNGPT